MVELTLEAAKLRVSATPALRAVELRGNEVRDRIKDPSGVLRTPSL